MADKVIVTETFFMFGIYVISLFSVCPVVVFFVFLDLHETMVTDRMTG